MSQLSVEKVLDISLHLELIFPRCLELTVQQWVSGLFSTDKSIMASWLEKGVLSTLHGDTDPLFSVTTIQLRK